MAFPSILKEVPEEAFGGCAALPEISLPEGVEHIGKAAFKDCRRLQRVFLPSTLAVLGDGAFSGCAPRMEFTFQGPPPHVEGRPFEGLEQVRGFYPSAHRAAWEAVKQTAAWQEVSLLPLP